MSKTPEIHSSVPVAREVIPSFGYSGKTDGAQPPIPVTGIVTTDSVRTHPLPRERREVTSSAVNKPARTPSPEADPRTTDVTASPPVEMNNVAIAQREGAGADDQISEYQKETMRAYPVLTEEQTIFLMHARDQDRAEETYLENGAQPVTPKERVREIRNNPVFPQIETAVDPEDVHRYNVLFGGSDSVKDLIVNGHNRLVPYFTLLKANTYDVPIKELVSIGHIGLEKAAEGYDPERGAWTTYVRDKMRGEWSTQLRIRNAALHSSNAAGGISSKVGIAAQIFDTKYQRPPSEEELLDMMTHAPKDAPYASQAKKAPTEEAIRAAVADYMHPINVSSLDQLVSEETPGRDAVLSDAARRIDDSVTQQTVMRDAFARAGLDDEHRNVLYMHVIEGMPIVAIGEELGKTRGTIERMRVRVLKALRNDPELMDLWSNG